MTDKVTENILISSGIVEKERKYWINKLAGDIPYVNITHDNKEIETFHKERRNFYFVFDEDISQEISSMAKHSSYGIYMILISGLYYILYRFTGCTDITIGSPVFKQESMEDLLNYTLPLRIQIESQMTFKEFLMKIKNMLNEANENMNYPYEKMLEIINSNKRGQNNKLFNIFSKFNSIHSNVTKYDPLCDFNFTFDWSGTRICCDLNYNAQAFNEKTVNNLFNSYLSYYISILKDNNVKLYDIEIVSTNDKNTILNEFNNTKTLYPREKTIHKLFEEQAEKTPDEIALVSENQEMTYHELNQRANQLADLLKKEGVEKEDIIAVIMPRSMELIVSILGVLKANTCCLPIDSNYPEERIKYILEDSGAKVIINVENDAVDTKTSIKKIEMSSDRLKIYSKENQGIEISSESIAYVIYTSGSTGEPKGVLLHHYGILNHIYTKIKELKIEKTDSLCFNLNVNFVASIWQIFTPLILGLKLFIYNERIIMNPYELIKKVGEDKISMLEVVPTMLDSYLSMIENETEKEKVKLNNLKKLILTGEKIQTSLVRKMYKNYRNNIELINAYGQSECSDDTLHYHIPYDEEIEKVPIGKPSNNTKLFILYKGRRLQPIGAIGELYISGDGISGGYLNQDNLTTEKFINNPYLPDEIMYMTGDQVRWLSDGNVEYIGRNDQQIKIRGNRVELGEIEAQLLKYKYIKETVVVSKEDQQKNNYLCSYVVSGDKIEVNELRKFLKNSLPEYMVPSYFVQLEKLPLTTNGKIDRKILPEPTENVIMRNDYEAARDEIEEKQVKIWKEVLGIERMGINDNFFNLGGNSLKAIKVISLNQKLGFDLQYNTLITYPTIKEIARFLNMTLSNVGEKISNLEKVGEIIKKETGFNARIIEYNVKGALYKVLYVLNQGKGYEIEQILKVIKEQCVDKIWPHYVISTSNDIDKIDYYKEISENEFFKIVSLKNKCEDIEVLSIIEELEIKETEFVNEIIKQKVIQTFPCSAVQKGTIELSGHMTGIIIPFDLLDGENTIFEALRDIISNHELFRSVLYQEGNEILWKEFKASKNITIPFIDVSEFDFKTKDKIIKDLVKQKYFKLYFHFESIHYRFILIKENLRSYKLIAPIDHILFDAMSSEIIIRSIREYIMFHNSNINKDGIAYKNKLAYKDYVYQLQKGPIGISPEQVIKTFHSEEYRLNANKVEAVILRNPGNKACSMDFKINLNEMNSSEGKIWEMSFFFTIMICRWVFNIEEVPLKIFYYGRSYMEQNYYDIVGYFTDFLPLLVKINENDINSVVDQVQDAISLVKKHNINFASLQFLNKLHQKWGKVSQYYKAEHLSELDQMILYNFQGKRDSYDKVKDYYDLGNQYFDNYRLEGSSFSIVSFYTNEELHLSVLSSFEIDEIELKKKFNDKLKDMFKM